MKSIIALAVCFSSFLVSPAITSAFDGDWEIANPDYQKDNFVDIKSYQPNKTQERTWAQILNGFRLVEGSLNLDISYLAMETRIRRSLSKRTSIYYHSKQEQFYSIKPLRQLLGIQFHLGDQYYVSAIGFPAYDKRKGDLGVAFSIGQTPGSYLEFSHLKQDLFYNKKNFEEDVYLSEPVEDRIKGSFQSKNLNIQFEWLLDRVAKRFSPNEFLTLRNKGDDFSAVTEFQFSQTKLMGMRFRSFSFNKERLRSISPGSDENENQNIQFLSSELYWIETFSIYTVTAGTQYDRFQNRYRNQLDNPALPLKSFNYRFETWQFFSMVQHPWNPNLSWEYGLYAGNAVELKNHISKLETDKFGKKLESKLRLSWEWHSTDKKSFLLLISTWNIDDFLNNFWDGGGVSFQMSF
ncbi:MAG: hypothetical protein HQM13_10565 [SAR324 cluster bacterium]|nr:hypothetical protein [SAR324 cluster bacterium]